MQIYHHTCGYCGNHFTSTQHNSYYCSSSCKSYDQYSQKVTSSRNNSNNESSGGELIPAAIFLTAAYFIWTSIRDWQNFDAPTKQLLFVYHYIFYKPIKFSTTIYDWIGSFHTSYPTLIFILKWGAAGFYIFLLIGLYAVIFEALKDIGLGMWRWIILFLPLISYGVFTFIPSLLK